MDVVTKKFYRNLDTDLHQIGKSKISSGEKKLDLV